MHNIGSIYEHLGDYNKALEYYLKSRKIKEETGDKRGIAYVLIGIGNIYKYQENYDLALEHFQKSLVINQEIGQSPYAGFLKSLTQPIDYQDRSQQRYNIARGQIQSGTRTAIEQAKTYMGGKGFRGGESGIADTAIGRLAKGGAERVSRASLEIGESEAERAQTYERLNLQRKLGGGQLALTGEESALDRMMRYYEARLGAETREFQPWWSGLSSGYPTG